MSRNVTRSLPKCNIAPQKEHNFQLLIDASSPYLIYYVTKMTSICIYRDSGSENNIKFYVDLSNRPTVVRLKFDPVRLSVLLTVYHTADRYY